MSTPTDKTQYLAAQLNEGFEALRSVHNDELRYALARLHGKMEYHVKYNEKDSFSIEDFAAMMKGVAKHFVQE